MTALNLKTAQVTAIASEDSKAQFILVQVGGREEKAVNYLTLGDRVLPGQEVLINTTAVDLNLGSGGYHYVLPAAARLGVGWGHLMKLRYTPLQLRVNSAEEQESPWHDMFTKHGGAEGIPVLAAELHSMLPPLALAIKFLDPGAKIAYVVTDGGALPAGFSSNIRRLKDMEVISDVITSGHSFGGDIEAINVFTGLQAAVRVGGAKYIIVAMGPGIAGTGTVYGFSGLEQGFVLQAAHALGGIPVLVPRIGFSDTRSRHRGISHHSLTILTKAYLGPAWVPLPFLRLPQRAQLHKQIASLPSRCRVHWREGEYIKKIAQDNVQLFSSMGRGYGENREFFIALGAAARLAVELYRSKPRS